MAASSSAAAVQQPAFDVAGARKAGYSDGEIASYLSHSSGFNLDAAKEAGYKDDEIVGFLTHPTTVYPKSEPKEEDSLLGSIGKGITSLPAAFERTVGGALRSAGETTPEPNIPLTGQESEDLEKGPLGETIKASAGTPGTPAHIGKEIFDAASAHLKENSPNVPAGSVRDYAYRITLGLGELVPIVLGVAATKSPALGAAAIAGQTYSEKYGEARENDRSIDQARADAGFTGLVNGSMAMLPLGAVMKPGASFLGKAASVAGANAFMGVATEALQMGYDKGILHQDMPLGEAITRIKDAGIVGAVTGALLGAGEHGLSHLTGTAPAPEPAPQAPTPEQKAAPVLAAPTVDAAIQAAQAAVHSEPIDIEAMGRTAQMQAEANAAAGTGERGVNDLLSDLDMQEGQIEHEAQAAPVQPQEAAPAQPAAAVPPPQEAPALPAPDAEQPLAATPEPDQDGLPSLADTTELQGRVRGAPRRVTNGPVDAATFLAMKGGIRNDEGHDLTVGRGLQQFVPGVGPLIRPNGLSMDYAGEALHEAGYFGPPESTPRPSENEVLQMLERTRRDDQGRPGKVYIPEDQARLDEAQQGKKAIEDNARALQDIHDEARAMGESLSPEEADHAVAYMGEHGLNPAVAVGEFLERKYSRLAEEYHEQTGDSAYAEASPVTRGQGEIDLGHGEGLERQEAVPFPESGSGEGRDAAAQDSGPTRQLNAAEIPPLKPHVGSWFIVDRATGKPVTEIFRNDPAIERLNTEKYQPIPADEWLAGLNRKPEIATEPGAAGLDQTIIPGAEASARQLAQAREDAGHGRIQPRAQQKPADNGLFGDKPEPTLFARRKDYEKDLIVQHNISAGKLLHADRLGGLAVPSLAVTKASHPMEGFGDITLLAHKDMADPKKGARVFGADIYSPRAPTLNYRLKDEALRNLDKELGPYFKEGERHVYSGEIDKPEDLRSVPAFERYAQEKSGEKYPDYQVIAKDLLEKVGAEERIFRGFNYNGNRTYKAHTLENVVAILKKEMRGGENWNYGVGSLRAHYTPQFRSVEAIKAAKGNLLPKEKFEAVKKEIDEEFWTHAEALKPYYKYDKNAFGFGDTVINVMADAAKQGLPRALREYGFENVPEDVMRDSAEFLSKLRHLPTEYFEVKHLRGVGVSEFHTAVIPHDAPQAVRDVLAKRGVRTVEYKKGDEGSRRAAIQRVAEENSDDLLFARREGKVTGTFSPEFDAKRAEVAAGLRKRLDELGLHDIALKLPDAIETPEGLQDGAYRDKIIAVALDAKDHGGVLDHEAIHALRALDLFKKSEWSILAGKAAREWRARYKIDERYGDFPEDRRNEEAVAEAFRYWVKGKGNQTGIVARLFDKMRNALSAVGNALRLRGFQTADSIFGKIDRGEVGARPGVAADPEAAMFARRNPPTEDEIYRDGVSDLISAASEGEGPTNLGARLLTKISEAGIKQLKNPNIIESEALLGGTLFPRTMASLDDMSARLWRPWMAREEETHANVESLRRVVSKSLVSLSAESRDKVYAALELARNWEWRPPEDGRPIRVRNTSYWQARKSKVGDDYVLNQAETQAFHDALKLGDEGWRMFMSGLAKREGWRGPVDASMIRAAANQAGEGLPEGKRLLRLAGAIEAAQAAINRPYFPAMRFGDYFIAVKPKIGTEENSPGGYPKVEWFETVEKPVLQDMLGKARLPAADTPGVKEALDRIKAVTKGDGSLAFTDETHDFEIGDLRSRPNVLRQLNIPAIEKLFMLMERGVTTSLRDKIMATNSPEEGSIGKEAAGLKQEAGEAAKAHYEATLGETKDLLLDAVYHDLLSGWKKSANMVPGYDADFDRAIGTHMYQVGRNSADMVYRNSIEDAYQGIQDNHPHISARQYWQHWRAYQENPQNAWTRAAGKTAQYGAAYVMGMNPSTTMMISAHTPIMAAPVLAVGGGMGHATAQITRGLRETYKALSFDKKKGAFIDTDQLGRTPREKALIAELDRVGLNHSLGADDVRNLNDRQAGLWGSAQPTMKKAMDIAMSNISAVDQANRNAIALAAHRMAMNPVTLEKMAKPWMEHNAIFRQMVMDEGLNPENFTKFMLSEAAGAWGKTNQAPMMRGMEGSLLFALHGFQTRFLSTAYKLMVNMGPAGKVAGAWMMAALWSGTGIYGLPFTKDLENAAGLLWKSLTGVDPMIDAHIRQFLQDAGLGKIGTEILLRGPLSVMSGIDLQSRMGFGDIITQSTTAADLLGTIPSIVWGRMQAAWNRERTGQGMGSAAAELLPAALRNPARAMIEKDRGQQSQQGTMLLTPENVTRSHTILRALGLPPLAAEQARDRSEYMRDLTKRDEELRHHTEEAAANLIIEAGKADREGDHALAHELSGEVANLVGDYNRDHWQAPVTQEGLSDAILQHTNPETYRLKKTPGRLRGEAYRNPY